MKNKNSNRNKIAVYCTADDNYIFPAFVALDSVRRFHPDCDYYVIGNKSIITEAKLVFLDEMGISFLHSDKNIHFVDQVWPNTAYLMLFGPELLAELGYRFSLGIDADVLCVKALDLDKVFVHTLGFSGIANKEPWYNYFENREFIKRHWNFTDDQFESFSTNTGVVFWNNSQAKNIQLGKRAIECFAILKNNGITVMGDQALFALVSMINPVLPFNQLDGSYNYRVGNFMDLKADPVDLKMIHYTGPKPWSRWKPSNLREFFFRPKSVQFHQYWHKFIEQQGVFTPDLCLKKSLI